MAKRMDAAGGAITKPFPGAVGGNPNGSITVVEFTDYNCGFCRSSVADLNRLVSSEKDVRIVYRELPILSPTSRDAARWALAAAKQGKHKAFHDAMFAAGPANEQTITAAARRAGLNMDQAAKDAASPEVNAEIERNLAMMQQIGFNGTPTFIIGDQMLEGALGYDALKAAVEKMRKKG
jgi:protein-disulfide isomerase